MVIPDQLALNDLVNSVPVLDLDLDSPQPQNLIKNQIEPLPVRS